METPTPTIAMCEPWFSIVLFGTAAFIALAIIAAAILIVRTWK